MPAITHTPGLSGTHIQDLGQGALADVVRALPLGTILVVPTPAHERDALVAWARGGGGGRPPVVITMSTLMRELCQAVAPNDNVLTMADAEAAFDHAARLCETTPSALGVTVATMHQWQRNGRTIDASGDALTGRQREKMALVERVIQVYTDTLMRIEAVDAVMHHQEALAKMSKRVHEGHRIRLRLRDEPHDVERLVLYGMLPLPVLERLTLQVLAAAGWAVAIRWAEVCTVVVDGAALDIDYVDGIMALTTGAVPWVHKDDTTHPTATVHVVRCTTKRSHDEAVLRITKEHCLQGGLRPADVAVVPAAADGTENFVRERGPSSGVPIADATALPLAQVPIVMGLMAAIDVVLSGWRRHDVERLARTGVLDDVVPNVHRLVAVARHLRIIGGSGLREWSQAIEAALSDDNLEADDRYVFTVARNAVDDLAAALPCEATPCTAAEALGRFEAQVVRPLRLEQTALRWQRRDESTGRTSLAVEALRAAREAMRSALTMAQQLSADVAPLAAHLGSVRAALGRAVATAADARLGGLRLLRGDALPGRTWPVVITTGWTEDAVAVRSADDIDALIAPGEREARARRTLLSAACAGQLHVYVLWPATIDDEDQMPAVALDSVRLLGAFDAADDVTALQANSKVLLDAADVRMFHAANNPQPQETPFIDAAMLHPIAAERLATARSAPYSASRLDMAAACMYQFAMRRVVRLDQVSYDDTRQTPLERGSMLHSILHEFINSLIIEKGAPIHEGIDLREWLEDGELTVLLNRLHAVARRLLGEPTWMYAQVDARALFGNENDAGILAQWLANTIKYVQNTSARIVGTEVEIQDTIVLDGVEVMVKGFIDRVDVTPDGTLVVVDYKNSLSSIPKKLEIEQGEKTQMVLYAKAAEQIAVAQGIVPKSVLGVYVNIGSKLHDNERDPKPRYGPNDAVKRLALSGQSADVLKSEQSVRLLLDRLTGTKVSVDPTSDAICGRCGLQGVCRIGEG
jgi:RecB family exonuclease